MSAVSCQSRGLSTKESRRSESKKIWEQGTRNMSLWRHFLLLVLQRSPFNFTEAHDLGESKNPSPSNLNHFAATPKRFYLWPETRQGFSISNDVDVFLISNVGQGNTLSRYCHIRMFPWYRDCRALGV